MSAKDDSKEDLKDVFTVKEVGTDKTHVSPTGTVPTVAPESPVSSSKNKKKGKETAKAAGKEATSPRKRSLRSDAFVLLGTGFLLFGGGVTFALAPEISPEVVRVGQSLADFGLSSGNLILGGLVFFALGVIARGVGRIVQGLGEAPSVKAPVAKKVESEVDFGLLLEQLARDMAQLRTNDQNISREIEGLAQGQASLGQGQSGALEAAVAELRHFVAASAEQKGKQGNGGGVGDIQSAVFQLAGGLDKLHARVNDSIGQFAAHMEQRMAKVHERVEKAHAAIMAATASGSVGSGGGKSSATKGKASEPTPPAAAPKAQPTATKPQAAAPRPAAAQPPKAGPQKPATPPQRPAPQQAAPRPTAKPSQAGGGAGARRPLELSVDLEPEFKRTPEPGATGFVDAENPPSPLPGNEAEPNQELDLRLPDDVLRRAMEEEQRRQAGRG